MWKREVLDCRLLLTNSCINAFGSKGKQLNKVLFQSYSFKLRLQVYITLLLFESERCQYVKSIDSSNNLSEMVQFTWSRLLSSWLCRVSCWGSRDSVCPWIQVEIPETLFYSWNIKCTIWHSSVKWEIHCENYWKYHIVTSLNVLVAFQNFLQSTRERVCKRGGNKLKDCKECQKTIRKRSPNRIPLGSAYQKKRQRKNGCSL